MSRSKGRNKGQLAGYRAQASGPIAAARALACAGCIGALGSCGGLQRGEPSDASAQDATQSTVGPDGAVSAGEGAAPSSVPLSVGPGEPDPCGASQNYEYQLMETFDTSLTSQQLAGQYGVYVSYDGSGILYQPNCGVGTTCIAGYAPGADENYSANYVAPNLCSSCIAGPDGGGGGPDGGGCNGCLCGAGFQPSTFGYPPLARCGKDTTALHLHASTTNGLGLSIWGMNVGIDLRQNCSGITDGGFTGPGASPNPCYFDAREWTGISFWALRGPGSTSSVALATVGDPNTAGVLGGTYSFNDLRCGNPACVPNQPGNVGMPCTATTMPLCLCDPLGQGIGLGEVNQWTFYAIPFTDLKQKGYGKSVATADGGSGLDLAHILSFTFGLGKANWDVWVDEVAFYRPKTH